MKTKKPTRKETKAIIKALPEKTLVIPKWVKTTPIKQDKNRGESNE